MSPEVIFDKKEAAHIETSEQTYENTFNSLNEYIYTDFLNTILKGKIRILFFYLYFIILSEFFPQKFKVILASPDKFKPGVEEGTRLFLESFQYPILNKNVRLL